MMSRLLCARYYVKYNYIFHCFSQWENIIREHKDLEIHQFPKVTQLMSIRTDIQPSPTPKPMILTQYDALIITEGTLITQGF